ncbi:hypothetical protein Purlil1_12855 [Purpureocillium lilacinum]|uniref:JmjC domain-containing protein n=1 Tax=Purpureocillium lilacinum TaxID=33203 RepID=A0ABR0BFX0_PURLI|nr:hypothetical protein Purlil1_12855 [Purpureocillium lilacinum]
MYCTNRTLLRHCFWWQACCNNVHQVQYSDDKDFSSNLFPPAASFLQRQLSSSDNCPPATTVLQRHLCSRDTFAPATTVLQRQLSSSDNCPPATTVLQRQLSSTDTCPPPTPVLHRHLCSETPLLQRQLSSSDNCPPATPALQRTCALATPVQPEFVHHYWPEWNPRNASVIKHVYCCEIYFVGKNWSKHHKETGHSGVEICLQSKKRQVSGGRCRDLCDTCAQVFLIKERKQHEYGTSHDHYIVLNPVNLERGVADLADLTELSASDLAMPTDSVGTANMRKKYDDLVRSLLRECLTSTGPALHNGTRWSRCLQQLRKILPADCEIPFARITTFPDMSDNNADVWYVTEDSMMQHFVNEDFVLRKPVVIKSQRSRAWECSSHSFLKDLGDHFAGSTVDVQDLTTTEKTAVKMGVDAVIKKIGEGADVPTGRLPINLLNLKYFGQSPPTPRFLNLSRFNVLPSISSHLEAEFSGAAIAGKRSRATAREVDLERSLIFSLFAQRGSFTGFHVDCPDGTWVCPEWGLKLWIFATSTDEADMVKFAEEGDEWAPSTIAAVVLEPGDVLIMPPAELVPHAVLTLEDSYMVGGMFMDAPRILDSIRKLSWIVTHPTVTNEPVPLQLLSGWSCGNNSAANAKDHAGRGAPAVDAHTHQRKVKDAPAGATVGQPQHMFKNSARLAEQRKLGTFIITPN